MWKVPVLLLVLGSASLWGLAGGNTVRPEDVMSTPGVEDGKVTPGVEDGMVTPGVEDGKVTPGVEDGMVTPGVEDGMVTPGVEDGKVTPGVEDGMVTPGVEDGKVTPGVEDGKVTPGVEDGMVTPGVEDGKVTPGVEDGMVTLSTSKGPDESAYFTTQGSTRTKDVTVVPDKHLSTLKSTVGAQEESQSTTRSIATDHTDGLAIVTLAGIIVGVLLAVGFIGLIIVVAVRKKSGRYSP
ncbi:podoplanin isoform X2 [Dasypus novemcinctus]|uniref:podoplanin isoform X2 n=1 Tax=Dasypus novemcinctus TaxID=9361 RepID=UPI00265DF4DA|nr:podoplanin isoform X2 [Dasypus novemcinctus]